MVLNRYDYRKKAFQKVHLNNLFCNRNAVLKDLSHEQRKSREKTFIRDKKP